MKSFIEYADLPNSSSFAQWTRTKMCQASVRNTERSSQKVQGAAKDQ